MDKKTAQENDLIIIPYTYIYIAVILVVALITLARMASRYFYEQNNPQKQNTQSNIITTPPPSPSPEETVVPTTAIPTPTNITIDANTTLPVTWKKLILSEYNAIISYPSTYTVDKLYSPDPDNPDAPAWNYHISRGGVRLSIIPLTSSNVYIYNYYRNQRSTPLTRMSVTIQGTIYESEPDLFGEGMPCEDESAEKYSVYEAKMHYWYIEQKIQLQLVLSSSHSDCNEDNQAAVTYSPEDVATVKKIIESLELIE